MQIIFGKFVFGELIVLRHLSMEYGLYNLFECHVKRLEKTLSQFQDKNVTVR